MNNKSTIVRFINVAASVSSRAAPPLAARLLEWLFLTPMRANRPEREVPWLQLTTRRSIALSGVGELVLYEAGDGPVVLLVHGWAGRGSQLGAFIQPLVARGFRVVTFDAPAHGDTDGRTSSLPGFATALRAVADNVGAIDSIVAHSLGAAATTIALAHGLHARRVVFVSPPDNPGEFLQKTARELGFTDGVTRRARVRMERRTGMLMADLCSRKLGPHMKAPLLIVHDDKDKHVPIDQAQGYLDAWPGARMHRTSGLGHHRIVRDPEVVALAVNFVAGAPIHAQVRDAQPCNA